ncbi:MAG: hypothetical protein WCD68_19725, partial [Candidatus Acidiferrum sp.]
FSVNLRFRLAARLQWARLLFADGNDGSRVTISAENGYAELDGRLLNIERRFLDEENRTSRSSLQELGVLRLCGCGPNHFLGPMQFAVVVS